MILFFSDGDLGILGKMRVFRVSWGHHRKTLSTGVNNHTQVPSQPFEICYERMIINIITLFKSQGYLAECSTNLGDYK